VTNRPDSTFENPENDGFDRYPSKGEMMRKKVLSAALSGALLAVATAATAYAQMPGTAVRATIPFDFQIRGKILPAGDYEIRRLTDEQGELVVSSVNDKHERAIIETLPVETNGRYSKAHIVFHRYGETYFLSEIFAGGLQSGRELPVSRQERNLKREVASNKTEPETVLVAAN
jgi:hypothetical protein